MLFPILLHRLDKGVWPHLSRINPLVFYSVNFGIVVLAVILYFALNKVHSGFLEKIDIIDIVQAASGGSGKGSSAGATVAHYLLFLFAFVHVPYIPSIEWDDSHEETLEVSTGNREFDGIWHRTVTDVGGIPGIIIKLLLVMVIYSSFNMLLQNSVGLLIIFAFIMCLVRYFIRKAINNR